jgi:hypothetical protein
MTSKTLDLTNISVIFSQQYLGPCSEKTKEKLRSWIIIDFTRQTILGDFGDSPTGWIGVAKSPRTVHEETEDFPVVSTKPMFRYYVPKAKHMIPTNQVASPSKIVIKHWGCWAIPKTMGFNTNKWSNDMDDLVYPVF